MTYILLVLLIALSCQIYLVTTQFAFQDLLCFVKKAVQNTTMYTIIIYFSMAMSSEIEG